MGLEIKPGRGLAIRILSILLFVCFALPSFQISVGTDTMTITGVALLTGLEVGSGQRMPANLGMLAFLYIPAGMFMVWHIFKGKRKRERDGALLSVVLSAAGLLGWAAMLVGALFYCNGQAGHFMVQAGIACNLLGYTTALILSVWSCYQLRDRELYVSGIEMAAPISRRRPAPEAAGYSLCPNCRQPIRPGFAFCSKCGARASGKKL